MEIKPGAVEAPKLEIDPELKDNDIKCCLFCCWHRNSKDRKKASCSKCCNRKIVVQRSLNRVVKTFSRFYTD